MDASGPPPPIEFGGDVVAWAAWAYYVDELTQAQVAQTLGVSRATVANYLAEARARRLVTIAMDPGALAQMQVGRALADRHGLQGAFVIPASGGPLVARLGAAGARVLAARLGPADVLGVAWGRTVHALAEALPDRSLPGVRVVQIAGSSLGGADFPPELCTATIARRLGAACVNLHAPGFLSSRQIRDALLAEPALQRQFALIAACDRVVFGVGNLEPGTRFADAPHLAPGIAAEYLARGAVCVAIGRFLDASGRETDGPLADCIIAMTLADLARAPERICVAGGPDKIAALRAVLRGGHATHLVTDMLTARALLEAP